MSTEYIERKKHGKGFRYLLKGKTVDKATVSRVASLAVPPAWTDVQISVNEKSKVQATGIDGNGKKQYIYSKAHTEKQEAAKFDRITSFAENLPKLRRQVRKDLKRWRFDKRKVTAAAVTLMDQEYFRVGNHSYARSNKTYGLTTLRSKHLTVKGGKAVFDFVGKSGQEHHRVVSDEQIARIIKKLDDMPGYELFRYYDKKGKLHNLTSSDVNDYIKHVMGDEYSAKDFRTWGGTLLAAMELAKETRPDTKTARKKAMTTCIKRVAKRLGNTPAIAKSSYIDPRIFKAYEASDAISEVYETVSGMRPRKYLSNDEQLVMNLLSN
jgi:DNA topoisomerase-1